MSLHHVYVLSRSLQTLQTVKKTARYKFFGKGGPKKAAPESAKAPKFYPADDVPVPRKSGRHVQKVSTLYSMDHDFVL